jgi:hypothetical protein
MKTYAFRFSTDHGEGLIVVKADSAPAARQMGQRALKEANLDEGLETKHPEEIEPEVAPCIFWD